MLLCLAVFLFSGWQVYGILREYGEAEAQYEQLEQYVSAPLPSPTTASSPDVPTPAEVTPSLTVDFDALSQINPDIVAWLVIEGTAINYPVVQGQNNDYYLNHQFDKGYNSAGCLFLDAANSRTFDDLNSVIYGHYMKNGTMFSALSGYKAQSFYDEHPTALLVTPAGIYCVQFFSGYVSDTASSAWQQDFSAEEYEQWLEELVERSCFSSDISPTAEHRVLTLSTCSYEFENARFVLHAIVSEIA